MKVPVYIGESAPYLYSLDDLVAEGEYLTLPIGSTHEYQSNNFAKLLQVVSSLGSCSLSNLLGHSSKTFFLGEKLRIRRTAFNIQEGPLNIRAKSVVASKRKGKSIVEIFDQANVMAYTFELDYTIFSEEAFRKLFKENSVSTDEAVAFCNQFPATRNIIQSDNQFIISVDPFTRQNCIGHFEGYPIVPAVFMANRLLVGIQQWLEAAHEGKPLVTHVDSLELFPNKAMPIDTHYDAAIVATKLAPKLMLFTCSILDKDQTEYGVYLITVQF